MRNKVILIMVFTHTWTEVRGNHSKERFVAKNQPIEKTEIKCKALWCSEEERISSDCQTRDRPKPCLWCLQAKVWNGTLTQISGFDWGLHWHHGSSFWWGQLMIWEALWAWAMLEILHKLWHQPDSFSIWELIWKFVASRKRKNCSRNPLMRG